MEGNNGKPRIAIITFLTVFGVLMSTVLFSPLARAETINPVCHTDATCSTEDVPDNFEFEMTIINESQYRIDIYWDNGDHGVLLDTAEVGEKRNFNTYKNSAFFITRHGVKEALFDLETNTKYRFISMRLGEIFVVAKDAAPSKDKCQDRFPSCTSHAANGECWSSPGWMIVHCCESCDEVLDSRKLIDSKIRCSKENLNITSPCWEPGDLHKLFVSWVTDDEYKKYDPVVLSSPDILKYGGNKKRGPWVITFDNFLTSQEADALIRGGKLEGFQRSTDQGAINEIGEMEKVVSQGRTSSNAWCMDKCQGIPEVQAVTRKIERVTGIPEKNYESFQILEYNHKQFYNRHHDESPGINTDPTGPRILTFFLYLSDVEEGGETHFDKLGIKVKPKKGRALVWPSVSDNNPSNWDQRMTHEAMPVIKGKKFAANHWIHLNDFMGPNFWGCTGSFA